MAKSTSGERTKVVVRKLPPGLTAEGFKSALDKVTPEDTYTWLSYHQGKVSTRKVLLSRAYIRFKEPAHLLAFKAAFDGHVFVTTKGTQFKCAIEYAPYQKVPDSPSKKNPLEGTIEQDPHYQAFLRQLEEGPTLLPSATAQREQQERAAPAGASAAGGSSGVIVTPLMAFLQQQHASGPGARGGIGGGGRASERDRATGRDKDRRAGDKEAAGWERRGGRGGSDAADADKAPAQKREASAEGDRRRSGAARPHRSAAEAVSGAAPTAARAADAAIRGGSSGKPQPPQQQEQEAQERHAGGKAAGRGGGRDGVQVAVNMPSTAAPVSAGTPKVLMGTSGGKAKEAAGIGDAGRPAPAAAGHSREGGAGTGGSRHERHKGPPGAAVAAAATSAFDGGGGGVRSGAGPRAPRPVPAAPQAASAVATKEQGSATKVCTGGGSRVSRPASTAPSAHATDGKAVAAAASAAVAAAAARATRLTAVGGARESAAAAGEGTPAGPPRRVRAGFQAYRPPGTGKVSRLDDDEG